MIAQRFCYLVGCCLLCLTADGSDAIDFDTVVTPLLSKAGCNAASCHGSAAGQAGFRLSLFGSDPGFDYRSIVNELEGRRLNHMAPGKSLLLAKPTGQLDHGGGEVLEEAGEAAQVIKKWIAEGAQRKQLRRLERLSIRPASFVASSVPASSQIEVLATFSDGSQRDVTRTAVYTSHNDAALTVGEAGEVVVRLAGQHAATVRFGDQVATFSAISPIGSTRPSPLSLARENWIDDEINAKLIALKLTPAPQSSDAEFLRRVSLDLTGRLPTRGLVERFVSDSSPTKRADLVDELLRSVEFTDYWTHRLAMQLRVRKPGADAAALDALYQWLRGQVADDSGWDAIAEAIVLSEGDTHAPGAATVHRFFATGREEAEYVSEVLMGVRLRCANCHNHPLDRWTQDDYHGLAVVFAGLERGQTVRNTGRGAITHPRTGEPAVARIPGERFLDRSEDGRRAFADWLTSPENPYFATAMAGRVWEALMGRGLVSPVDDLRATNPPSHPELLDRLADDFAQNGYELRRLIRLICSSAAYNRQSGSTEAPQVADRLYTSAAAKRLTAEVLADAISDVTGVADDYHGANRAIHVVDRELSVSKLEYLGQCPPGESCSADGGIERGIAAQLHLMNGSLLNAKLRDPQGRLHTLIDEGASTAQLVGEFYWDALSRPPTDEELVGWVDQIDSSPDQDVRTSRLEDFLWALLNCHEFSSNH